MKRLSILATLILAVVGLQAQNEMDALRYSRLDFGGTARSVAMGNAFSSLGGDVSTLSTNPAGLGLFKKHEIILTPSFTFGSTESKFYGQTTDEYHLNAGINNFGFVFAFTSENPSIKNLQFGFAKNRLASFNNDISIVGFNNESSLVDYYQHIANGTPHEQLDQFGAYQMWSAYLIDNFEDSDIDYFNDMDQNVLQKMRSTTNGKIDEYTISGAINLMDRFYFGATLGVPVIDYSVDNKFSESDSKNLNDWFSSMSRNEYIQTKGRGINLKFGTIVRVTNWLRLGAAYHTPSAYKLTDKWEVSTEAFYDKSPEGEDGPTHYKIPAARGINDEYTLLTPQRFIGSAAFVFKKFAILSVEYEHVDYSQARLGSTEMFYNENQLIKGSYGSAHNVKAGLEARAGIMSVRLGTGFYGDPFKTSVNNQPYIVYSGGVGLNLGTFFVDLAYVTKRGTDKYYIYDAAWVKAADNKYNHGQFLISGGIRF